ncbi:MAG: hypothetical protein DRJ31_01790 [Candidatus Methanomethylicota archaeon]|mgnify:CR=1 FL=1|uniref:Uncharacterized protein n=1 Tax=Thermoproteota archaeon TaxID=2056631 RepID=A0A497ETH9_9CREN|nr:MAG: hypothetical protein DRJ31_01790 [Candidatus Verstraetearchaeota archaeon]
MRFKLFTEEDARKYLSRLAKDAQVPEPKLIISDEPFKNLPSDVDWDRPAFYSRKEKAIYIRPKKVFLQLLSLTSLHIILQISRVKGRGCEWENLAIWLS